MSVSKSIFPSAAGGSFGASGFLSSAQAKATRAKIEAAKRERVSFGMAAESAAEAGLPHMLNRAREAGNATDQIPVIAVARTAQPVRPSDLLFADEDPLNAARFTD